MGFIAGDGSISLKDNCIKLKLHVKDELQIDKFINAVNTTNKKYYSPRKWVGTYWNNPGIEIRVYSKQMIEDLKKYGIGPKKSFTLKFPKLPKKYIRHFIRGIFDADGCITKSKNQPSISIVGTYNILNTIKKELNWKNKISWDRSIRQISKQGRNVIREFYNYLYKDATIYLDRKKQRFEELLNDKIN